MSNYLAIASVTACLREKIKSAVQEALPGAVTMPDVTTEVPKENPSSDPARVNIYLYQTTVNTGLNAMDLPRRTRDGVLRNKPMIALDLHYLFSFFGDETNLEPQRLFGRVVSHLNAVPFISKAEINAVKQAAENDNFIKHSDLDQITEAIKFSPASMNLDEISKLWSVFFQTPYVLSTAYTCSVVILEEDMALVSAKEVDGVNLMVNSIPEKPEIISIVRNDDLSKVIIEKDKININGKNFKDSDMQVHIAGVLVNHTYVSSDKIELTLPDELKAGKYPLKVVFVKSAPGETTQVIAQSNISYLIVRSQGGGS